MDGKRRRAARRLPAGFRLVPKGESGWRSVCRFVLLAMAFGPPAGHAAAPARDSGGAASGLAADAFRAARARGMPEDGILLLVSVANQQLSVMDAGRIRKRYRISTSSRGVGSQSGSYRTPPGWHRVAERFGARERPGRVFVARRPTERLLRYTELRSDADEDLVVTRILWLEGLEPGINRGGAVDSYRRYIYLHGTNQEHRLGTPASRGCIRLSNRDILELFELTEGRETWCRIDPE